MNQAIFAIVCHAQESLIAIREEDELITRVMETTGSVQDLVPHFMMLKHYASRLRSILDEFEVETLKEHNAHEETRDCSG